jgi:hypothetical protein
VRETKLADDTSSNVAIFDLVNQILLKLQIYIQKDMNVEYTQIPSWLHQLFESMRCEHPRLSLSSIDTILEIVKAGSMHKNCLKLSNLITDCLHLGIQELSLLNSLAVWEAEDCQEVLESSNSEKNYMKELFLQLWSLLDYHYQDNKVIESILFFSKRFPKIFTFAIEVSFHTKNEHDLEVVQNNHNLNSYRSP